MPQPSCPILLRIPKDAPQQANIDNIAEIMPTSAATVVYAAAATRLYNKMRRVLPTDCMPERPIACSTNSRLNGPLFRTENV